MEEGYDVINNSEEINLLDYCYHEVLIPNGFGFISIFIYVKNEIN